MATTLGQMREQLTKLPCGAGIDPILLNGYVNRRIELICQSRPWTRLHRDSDILTTIANYTTGTVSIAIGATSGTGSGTTFTPQMTGYRLRIANLIDWYTFTYVSATSFTIDAPYLGDTSTTPSDAVDATFTLWQPVIQLPANLAEIRSIQNPAIAWNMTEQSQDWLDDLDPSRLRYGFPKTYVPFEQTSGDVAQIELYPGPIIEQRLPFKWKTQPPVLVNSSDIFPSWISTMAIFHGVQADLYEAADDQNRSLVQEQKFDRAVMVMASEDARRMPSGEIKISEREQVPRKLRTMRSLGRAALKNWNGVEEEMP